MDISSGIMVRVIMLKEQKYVQVICFASSINGTHPQKVKYKGEGNKHL